MTDEEKKAIEYLKIEYEKLMKEDNILFPLYKSDAKRLIDIIEKQSKEIEELKQNIHLKEVYVLKTNDYIKGTNIEDELCNKKWEDKIKAEIEELIKEGNYRTADNPNGRVHFQKEITDYQIEVLQSLLEKE